MKAGKSQWTNRRKFAFSDEATLFFHSGYCPDPDSHYNLRIHGCIWLPPNATLSELALPFIGTSGLIFIVVGVFSSVALGHRLFEKRAINHLFGGEIWECWQFSSSAWGAQVEADCSLISPRDEGLEAYQGAIYSSIFGIIIAIILIVDYVLCY